MIFFHRLHPNYSLLSYYLAIDSDFVSVWTSVVDFLLRMESSTLTCHLSLGIQPKFPSPHHLYLNLDLRKPLAATDLFLFLFGAQLASSLTSQLVLFRLEVH